MIENLQPEEVRWNIVTGISVGGLNGIGISMHKVGDETTAKEFLLELWRATSRNDVYSNWVGGIVTGALFKPGLFNFAPIRDFLRERIGQP